MLLKFMRYGTKLYAQTPAGELAFGDSQGLYEWRGGRRIDHTGGDQQAAVNGQMMSRGRPGNDSPMAVGIHEALIPYFEKTN